ncbi:diguanylate cyclase domain-containing protein [Jiella pelagia]|uniref:Diguanylate cyclase n=1 Tax=Jiella pelagia TaxID=2986949 RepID=A0ABY7BUR3_9HYPH|nr:diguanylate cyclase [Jiella pelagia]WAP67037.1 diguanylate cyclase [Jiella pelagia]
MSNATNMQMTDAPTAEPGRVVAAPLPSKKRIATIAALEARMAEQDAVIRQLEAEVAHSRKIFDRASAAAQIGVWECELCDCSLRWSDVVYDIFDLPRGSALDRGRTLECYPKATREELERIRSKAIEDRTGFCLDAEIVTARGVRRWIRITASVECIADKPVRIFGMKQDITAEKAATLRLRYMAEFDCLTGLANRSRFQALITGEPADGVAAFPAGAVMLIDLDRFKEVNDEFGHLVGDDCLKEVGRRLSLLGRRCDCIARIGGDEFAVVFGPQTPRATIRRLGAAVVRLMRRPMHIGGRRIDIGASVGIAFSNGTIGDTLYCQADAALYAAKAAGRGTVSVFDGRLSIESRSRLK